MLGIIAFICFIVGLLLLIFSSHTLIAILILVVAFIFGVLDMVFDDFYMGGKDDDLKL